MNQDSSQEVFQLPVPVRGFLNLRVRLPPKDDPRRVELVSNRRSARLYKVDEGGESLAVKVINRLKYKDFVRMGWKNIARREHDSALLLLEAGIRVPQPRRSEGPGAQSPRRARVSALIWPSASQPRAA